MEVTLTASTGTFSLITALTVLVLYISVQRADTKRVSQHQRYIWNGLTEYLQAETLFEGRHGCGAPRRLRYKWPLALDLIVNTFRKIGEKQVLQWFLDVFERTGPTFEQHILGAYGIDTIEPENLESILSTNFAGKWPELGILPARLLSFWK